MKGFFSSEKVKNTKFNPKNPQSCASCGLYKNCLSPKMKPYGKNKKKVLFLGEAPGEVEDKRGKQWQGKVGSDLQRVLSSLGFNLFRDGFGYNACNCRPPGNETPTPNQIYCCRKKALQVIKEYKPHVIFLLGSIPVESIIGDRWKKKLGGITKWRGWQIPDQDLKAWVCPVYHPSFVSRNEKKGEVNQAFTIWKRDLKKGLELIDKPLPDYSNEESKIVYVDSNKHFKSLIHKIKKADLLSFDYETTGLNPHEPSQKLISASVAFNDDQNYAWLFNKYRLKQWKKLLQSKVPKTAHNIPFEENWSFSKVGTSVNNWKICTMNSTHCLDNRRGVNGLKFQTYVNFGIPDYDSEIEPYLKSDIKKFGTKSHNKILDLIEEKGEKALLKYNALDSRWGELLAKKHIDILF